MKRAKIFRRPASQALWILICSVALMTTGCSSDVTFSPTTPVWTDSLSEIRTLNITGSLTAEDGSCIEATVLFDGEELVGARALCSKPNGCGRLELEAIAYSTTGHHTIAFQTLRQSKRVVAYAAEGAVLVSRDGLSLGGATLKLGPSRARLRAGEAVTFPVEFRD